MWFRHGVPRSAVRRSWACFAAAVACLSAPWSSIQAAEPARRPNIVLFLADDLGWGDLGCYGHPIIRTPHLDRFAKQGARFTQCYSASAVCSPSRSAILTGRTPYRNGVFNWIPERSEVHLRTSEIALPRLLKQNGYATCHVGKWHLNGWFNDSRQPQPGDHGYDWWTATQNNAAPSHRDPANFVRNGKPVGAWEGYSSHLIVGEAVEWLKTRRAADAPFFLAVWAHEPHYPIAAAPEFRALYPGLEDEVQLEHHANVSQLDAAFGKLMAALDEAKLAEETIVVFTSDNGPEGDGVKSPGRGSTGGLRGRKRAVYEGGIRVPGIVRWPGKTEAGSTCDAPVVGSDLFVTLAKAGGAALPADRVLDGGDFLPALAGGTVQRARPLYWRCPIAPGTFQTALRQGDWKILADAGLTRFELYDVQHDPRETKEMSAAAPDKLAEMKTALAALNAEIEAEGPDWWKKAAEAEKAKPRVKGKGGANGKTSAQEKPAPSRGAVE